MRGVLELIQGLLQANFRVAQAKAARTHCERGIKLLERVRASGRTAPDQLTDDEDRELKAIVRSIYTLASPRGERSES